MFGLKLLGKMLEEEKPEVEAQRCVRKFRRATCDRCLQDCPAQAIQLGTIPRLDESRCVGCGICANVCPTGAFVSPTIERLVSSVEANGGRFFCSRAEDGARSGIEVPCLGMLNEGMLIAAVLPGEGRRILSLDVSHCRKCQLRNARVVIDRTVDRANSILRTLGSEKTIILDDTARETQVAEQQRSRRDFFNYLRGQALKVAAESVDDILDETLSFTQVPRNSTDKVPIKHAILQHEIEALLANSPEDTKQGCIPFGSPLPPDKCEFCGICATACPSDALKIQETDDDWELLLEKWRCLDCRACVDTCPTNGLRYGDSREAFQMIAEQHTTLIHADKIACASCGRKFASPNGEDLCPSCEKGSGIDDFFTIGPSKQSHALSTASHGKER